MTSFSNRLFSSMGEDEADEQNNKCIKTDGGAIGLFDNADALAEWAMTGQYVADIIYSSGRSNQKDEYDIEDHHEDTDKFESQFRQHRDKLLNRFARIKNPFNESEKELIDVYSRLLLLKSATNSVSNAHEIGRQQYEFFKQHSMLLKCSRYTGSHQQILMSLMNQLSFNCILQRYQKHSASSAKNELAKKMKALASKAERVDIFQCLQSTSHQTRDA